MKTPKATPNIPPEGDPAEQTRTAENTPVPGGGSWHWDASLPGWRDNYTPATPETQPTPE